MSETSNIAEMVDAEHRVIDAAFDWADWPGSDLDCAADNKLRSAVRRLRDAYDRARA